MKLLALLLLCSTPLALAALLDKHPVRQELIDEIKAKTTSWIPSELHENSLKDIPID